MRIDKNRSLDTDAETLVTTKRNVIYRPEGSDEDYPSLAVVNEALVRLVPKYGVYQIFAGGQQHCAQEEIECILSVLESTAFVEMTGVKTEQTTTCERYVRLKVAMRLERINHTTSSTWLALRLHKHWMSACDMSEV